ncbi:hypothetical protein A0J61_02955 [Choanephora cucurbitarum]|uniref:Uncharacterized protein n=1 Tax=Choanephora cucurbitarum TaxID=101091 RepID=A0A1C7NP12_9FUNG|nr:hypothetical protein A0J61_02955 [Choanephora cucurbitarum]
MTDSQNDEKSQCKTDGSIQVSDLKSLELLLIQISSCFGNTDKTNLNFDHHKGMFGAFSVLKCISDDFSFASVEDFIKQVVSLAEDKYTHLYLWSLSYTKEGLFDLFLEASLLVQQGYETRQDYLPELKNLENSIRNVLLLRERHYEAKADYRCTDKQGSSLADLVNQSS